jgi:hypothetical protein
MLKKNVVYGAKGRLETVVRNPYEETKSCQRVFGKKWIIHFPAIILNRIHNKKKWRTRTELFISRKYIWSVLSE